MVGAVVGIKNLECVYLYLWEWGGKDTVASGRPHM